MFSDLSDYFSAAGKRAAQEMGLAGRYFAQRRSVLTLQKYIFRPAPKGAEAPEPAPAQMDETHLAQRALGEPLQVPKGEGGLIGPSLLDREREVCHANVTPEQVASLFDGNWLAELDGLSCYFEENGLFAAIQGGLRRAAEQTAQIEGATGPGGTLAEVAGGMVETLSGLAVGGELLHIGQVTKKKGRTREALERMAPTMLPDGMASNLLRGHHQAVAAQIREIIEPKLKKVAGPVDNIRERVIAPLADNMAARILASISEQGGRLLPDRVKRAVRESLDEDLRELGLLPRSEERRALAARIWQRMSENGTEDALVACIEEMVPQLHHLVNGGVDRAMGAIQTCLPATARDLMEGVGLSEWNDPFWLQIKREGDDNYTVVLYCRDSGHHPQPSWMDPTKRQFPLVYRAVKKEQLDADFFTQLLIYEHRPKWDPLIGYSLDNLVESLMGSLGIQPTEGTDTMRVDRDQLSLLSQEALATYCIASSQAISLQELELQLFDARVNAFLDLFAQTEREPTFRPLAHPDYGGLLDQLSHQLGGEALSLYRKRQINLDRLNSIAATIQDFRRRYRKVVSRAPQREERPPTVLPEKMQRMLKTLLVGGGATPATIELIKTSFRDILGDQLADPLDSAIDEFIPELIADISVPREAVEQSWSEIFSIGSVRRQLDDIKAFRPSLLHVYRLYAKYAWVMSLYMSAAIGASVLRQLLAKRVPYLAQNHRLLVAVSGLLVEFGPAACKKLVPEPVYEVVGATYGLYRDIMGYITQRILTAVMRQIVRQLMTPAMVDELHRSLQHMQQHMTRDGTLSFDLPATQIEDPSIVVTIAPESTGETPDSAAGQVEEAASAPIRPAARPRTAPVRGEGMREHLRRIVEGRPSATPWSVVETINRELRCIRPPKSHVDAKDYWKAVAGDERSFVATMEDLNALLLRQQAYLSLTQRSRPSCAFQETECVASSQLIYCLMDSLCRARYPSLFEGYLPGGVGFIRWLHMPSRMAGDYWTEKQLAALERYQQVPGSQDSWKTLFSHQGAEILIRGDAFSPEMRTVNLASFAGSRLGLFFRKCLSLSEPASALGLGLNMVDPDRCYQDELPLSSPSAGSGEEYAQLADAYRKGKGLPPGIWELRFAHEFSASLSCGGCPVPDKSMPEGLQFEHVERRPDLPWGVGERFVRRHKGRLHALTGECFRRLHVLPNFTGGVVPEIGKRELDRVYRDAIEWKSGPEVSCRRRTFELLVAPGGGHSQAESLMAGSGSEAFASGRDLALCEMVTAAKTERAIRAMGFFRRRLDTLSKVGLPHAYLGILINQPGVIAADLDQNPTSVRIYRRFFSESIERLMERDEWQAAIDLALIAVNVGESSRKALGELGETWPDYREVMRKALWTIRASHVLKLRAYTALIESYRHVYPETSSDLLPLVGVETAVKDLLRLRSMETTGSGRGGEVVRYWGCSSGLEAYFIWDRFAPFILEVMAGDEVRVALLDALAHDRSIVLPPDHHWEGEFPTYHSRGVEISFDFEREEEAPGSVTRVKNRATYREIDGVVYEELDPNRLTFDRSSLAFDQSLWIESGENPTHIFCIRGLLPSWREPIVQDKDGNWSITHREAGDEWVETDDQRGVSLLRWFAEDGIRTFVHIDQPGRLGRIELKLARSQLDFVVRDGKAYSTSQFPGYFIAPRQKVKWVEEHPTSLLLESDEGEKQVVIRPQNISMLIANLALERVGMGSLSPFLERLLEGIQGAQLIQEEYYLYRLDPKRGLITPDPKALAYLLIYYASHGKEERARAVLRQLEDKARMTPLEEETHRLLATFSAPLLAMRGRWPGELALRLSAISIENQMVHKERLQFFDIGRVKGVLDSTGLSEPPLELIQYFLIQTKLSDYVQRQGEEFSPYLSEKQELFLLKFLELCNRALIDYSIADHPTMKGLIRKLQLDSLVGESIMSSALRNRYQLLQAKHGEGSLYRRTAEGLLLGSEGDAGTVLPRPEQWIRDRLPAFLTQSPSLMDGGAIKSVIIFSRTAREHFRKFTLADETMEYMSQSDPWKAPLELERIGHDEIVRYFPAYYRLALGDVSDGRRHEAELFQKRAPLLAGQYDSLTGRLVAILIAIARKELPKDQLPRARFVDMLVKQGAERYRLWRASYEISSVLSDGYVEPVADCTRVGQLIRKRLRRLDRKATSQPYPSLEALITHLSTQIGKRHLKESILSSAVAAEAGKVALGTAVTRAARAPLTLLAGGRWLDRGYDAARRAVQLGRTVRDVSLIMQSAMGSRSRAVAVGDVDRGALGQRDRAVDAFFDEILGDFFERSEAAARREEPVAVVGGEDASLQVQFAELNESLAEYRARPVEAGKRYRLTGDVGELREALTAGVESVSTFVAAEQKAIVKLANQRQGRIDAGEGGTIATLKGLVSGRERLTFDEIYNAFARGEESVLLEHPRMTEEKLQQIKKHLYNILVLSSRFNLLVQALEGGRIDEIPHVLSRRRVYSFDDDSERFLRAKLLFEARQGVLLWKKPHALLQRMLNSGDSRMLLELIMGSGKTACLIPMDSYVRADQKTLLVNVWPAPVAGTNMRDLSEKGRAVYDQAVNVLRWARGQREGVCLWALSHLARHSREDRALLNTTKADLQGVELSFIEELLDLQGKFGGQADRSERLEAYRKILADVRRTGRGMIDEPHVQFAPKAELIFPVGSRQRLQPEDVDLVKEILICLSAMEDLEAVIGVKTAIPTPLSSSVYESLVRDRLAGAVAAFDDFGVPESERGEVARYLAGQCEAIPQVVRDTPAERRRLFGLAKGVITTVLPLCLGRTINCDFTVSKERGAVEEFARPSEGNDNPVESATIKNPVEALVKTGLMKLHGRLSDRELGRFVTMLRRRGVLSMQEAQIPFDETPQARFFQLLCPGRRLDDPVVESRPGVLEALRANDRVTMCYVSWFIARQIHYFPTSLVSNPVNFGAMFAGYDAMDGSPYNRDCCPSGTEPILDPGTDGETVDILKRKCAAPGSVGVLEGETPRALLEEILRGQFVGEPAVSALIDRGAVLNGLSNEEVARQMLEVVARTKGVVFYNDRKELVILERGAGEPIPLAASRLKVEERLTYFDECHTYAADVPQMRKAVAILTVGKQTTFEGLAQATWRMRGLKRLGQGLRVVMTKSSAAKISSEEVPTIDAIIRHCAEVEREALRGDKFQADIQKVHDVLRRAVLDKILEASGPKEMMKIARHHESALLSTAGDDFFALYGGIDRFITPEELLAQTKARVRETIERSPYFVGVEQQALSRALDRIGGGDYPEKVHVYESDDGGVSNEALADLERAAQVQQDQEADNEDEDEAQKETENEAQRVVNQAASAMVPEGKLPEPWEWKWDNLGVLAEPTKWCATVDPSGAAAEARYRETGRVASPIFSVAKALEKSTDGDIGALAGHIDRRLSATANFLQVVAHGSGTAAQDAYGRLQKPTYHLLVIKDGSEGPLRFLLLDQKEGNEWKRLLNGRHLGGASPFALYDVEHGEFVATNETDFPARVEKFPLWNRLIAQVRFLNGEVKYSEEEGEALLAWLKRGNPKQMEEAFLSIHQHLQVEAYGGSQLETLFLRAQDLDPTLMLRV